VPDHVPRLLGLAQGVPDHVPRLLGLTQGVLTESFVALDTIG